MKPKLLSKIFFVASSILFWGAMSATALELNREVLTQRFPLKQAFQRIQHLASAREARRRHR